MNLHFYPLQLSEIPAACQEAAFKDDVIKKINQMEMKQACIYDSLNYLRQTLYTNIMIIGQLKKNNLSHTNLPTQNLQVERVKVHLNDFLSRVGI